MTQTPVAPSPATTAVPGTAVGSDPGLASAEAADPDNNLSTTAASADSSLTAAMMAVWLGFRLRLFSQLQLLTLETQRAAQSLVHMLMLALFAALLLISCWLCLLGVGILLLKSAGLSTLAALSCILVLNLLALLLCLKLIRSQSCYLCFPATMALLKPTAAEPATPHTSKEQNTDGQA